MIKHFVNLTNGIERIPELLEFSFIRIQSTTIERKNWYKLFIDLDHNLLMWLALGAECRVYDYGTNRPLSKTIYFGIPVIEYCLNKYWLGFEQEKVMIGRNKVDEKKFVEEEIYQRYFVYHDENFLDAKIQVTKRLKYYRKYATNRVNLIGVSESTSHDSDMDFYKGILSEYIGE